MITQEQIDNWVTDGVTKNEIMNAIQHDIDDDGKPSPIEAEYFKEELKEKLK